MKSKPKRNYVPGPLDNCQTPAYALDPILPFLDKSWLWWEPAVGTGNLFTAMLFNDYEIFGSDILTGNDFFSYSPEEQLWDGLVTNPPYSLKFKWIARCYDLGKPWALLVPAETPACQKAIRLFQKWRTPEIMYLDNRIHFEMPFQGLNGSGAQFPVIWLCHKILPEPLMFGHIEYPPEVLAHLTKVRREKSQARKAKAIAE